MKKILSLLSSIGLVTSISSSVVACGWTSGGNTLNPPIDDEEWEIDENMRPITIDNTPLDRLDVQGRNLNDWEIIYSAYLEWSNQNLETAENTQEMGDINPFRTMGLWYNVIAQEANFFVFLYEINVAVIYEDMNLRRDTIRQSIAEMSIPEFQSFQTTHNIISSALSSFVMHLRHIWLQINSIQNSSSFYRWEFLYNMMVEKQSWFASLG